MYLIDYHIHTDCSPDAEDNAMIICEYAVRAGMREIAITDHYECNGWEGGKEIYYNKLQAIFTMKKAASVFANNLLLRCGVELGQPTQNLAAADALLKNDHYYDFVLASLHNLKGERDFFFLDYNQVDVGALFSRYLNELEEIVDYGNFDCLAHLSYPLRYLAKAGKKLDLAPFEEQIRHLLRRIVDAGKGIEINTSGLRGELGETMPNAEILRMYKDIGGEILTVGSDAHECKTAGAGIREALALAEHIGFEYIATFSNRRVYMIPINA